MEYWLGNTENLESFSVFPSHNYNYNYSHNYYYNSYNYNQQ